MEKPAFLLPVEETISASWGRVSGAKGSIWAAIGITFAIVFAIGFITGFIGSLSNILGAIFNLVGQIISTLLQLGLLYLGIQRAKNAPINFRQVFRGFEKPIALRVIGVYVIQFLIFLPLVIIFMLVPILIFGEDLGEVFTSGLTPQNIMLVSWCVLGGLIGLFITLRLILSMGFVLDMGADPWPAIKMSYEATRGNFFRLLAIFLFQIVVFILGAIPLGIGLIWVLPLVVIVYGMVYKNLLVNLSL